MQQATANVLADMGAQPATLQSGLVVPTPSADHTPPVSVVTSPAAGAAGPRGIARDRHRHSHRRRAAWSPRSRCRSTAAPPGRGRPGTTAWSFTFLPTALGPLTIRSRAVDDSVNVEQPGPGVTVTGVARGFPASIWHDSVVPGSPAINDANPIEVGLKFRTARGGLRHRRALLQGRRATPGPTWATCGAPRARSWPRSPSPPRRPAGGSRPSSPRPWPSPATRPTSCRTSLRPGTTPATSAGSAAPYEVWPLRALGDGEDGPNGRFRYGSTGFPDTSYSGHQLLGRRRVRHRRPPRPDGRRPRPGSPASTAWRSTSSPASGSARR